MEKSLIAEIEDNFIKYKDKLALVWNRQEITYGQLHSRTLETVDILQKIGVNKNARILISVEDAYDFIVIWIAIWMCKAIPIPVETKVTDNEIKYAMESGKCHFIIADRKVSSLTDDFVKYSDKIFFDYIYYETKYSSYDAKEDTALLFYTSGTTGMPKCVMFSHYAMYGNIVSLCKASKMNSDDTFLTPISPYLPASLATVVLPGLVLGATIIISGSALPGKLIRIIDEYKVTVFFAVPFVYKNMLIAMESREKSLFDSVNIWLTSSASMESEIYDKFYSKYNIFIHSIYCSSECGAITYNSSQNIDEIKMSVGMPLEGVYIKIIDENGKECKIDETGEIIVTGRNIFSGYYQKEDLTKQVHIEDWVKTGDLGSINKNGLLSLKGRISDTINIAGYLVNPTEVEKIILAHKDILDVLVYREINKDGENIIAAKIILKNREMPIEYGEFYRYCSKYLTEHKIPKRIEIVESISSGRYGKKKR